MKDIKSIVARNLCSLRRNKGITQAQLAEKFNYSDKAVCRWEGGETLPDINVLYALAEFYGVSMNDLVDDGFSTDDITVRNRSALAYKIWMCLLIISSVWIFAAVAFAFSSARYWLAFIIAVPLTCIVILASLKKHLGVPGKIIVASFLSWSSILTLYLHGLIYADKNAWYFFIVGIPLQAFVIHLFYVRRYRAKRVTELNTLG